MAKAAKRICSRCRRATAGAGCEHCGQPKRTDERKSAAQRGYNAEWRRAREDYLRRHPFCVECKKAGRLQPARAVDHIVPHRGDPELFWDETNWQGLCITHHNAKTGKGL
jgi:5-methylcytosine-specific restriction protein A